MPRRAYAAKEEKEKDVKHYRVWNTQKDCAEWYTQGQLEYKERPAPRSALWSDYRPGPISRVTEQDVALAMQKYRAKQSV